MSSVTDVERCLAEMNQKYPRPGLEPLAISRRCNVLDVTDQWPDAEKPGVYVFFSESGDVEYVGKTSCSQHLGRRIRHYFDAVGVPKNWQSERSTNFVVVALPREHAFEAGAIEEFLIQGLNPPRNKNGLSASE